MAGFLVQIVHDLHVIGQESDRVDQDVLDSPIFKSLR